MKTRRIAVLLSAITLSSLAFVGCSSEPEHGLSITAISPIIDTEKAEEYAATITVGEEALPVLLLPEMMTAPSDEEVVDDENYEPSSDDVYAKSAEMMGAAGMMKVSAQISAKEVDIIISDYENAQRLSEGFMPLSEVFTAEELEQIDETLFVSYGITDDEGNVTDEMMPASGIDVTNIEAFSEFMSGEQLVCHIVGNTENFDASKEYMMSMLG